MIAADASKAESDYPLTDKGLSVIAGAVPPLAPGSAIDTDTDFFGVSADRRPLAMACAIIANQLGAP
jgi:hypothetical protein